MELTQEEKMMLAAKQQMLLQMAKSDRDDYDPYTGKYAFCEPSDEEYDAIAEEVHDNLIRSLVEAGGIVREARELLTRSLEMLYLLGYDSSFTNPAIDTLTNDIKKYLEETT